ncbi:MAG: tRNA-dihydrouridine synthase family protein [Opitutales bacterium]|nr:tRNA-dihydrouridine synthase family protein [Opitutales bacterium]
MELFDAAKPVCALAPMQDITDFGFMSVIAECGAPDFFVAEYFRVHEFSTLEKSVLKTVLSSPASKPVAAQIIGEDEFHIARTISLLKKYPQIKYLDLNIGCPAPKVYRKNVGGGLLKEPKKIRSILKAMRENWGGFLSVKTRLGFDSADLLEEIVGIINESGADFLTLHGRTVRQLYRGEADYGAIKKAASLSKIPLIANGDLTSAKKALEVAAYTGASGVMIGRHAVRNPWIFRQINELRQNREMFLPTLADAYEYVEKIHEHIIKTNPQIRYADGRMKKFLNFIGLGVDEDGAFLNEMRRAEGVAQLFEICKKHMLKNPSKPFALEPYPNLCSRPNHEL